MGKYERGEITMYGAMRKLGQYTGRLEAENAVLYTLLAEHTWHNEEQLRAKVHAAMEKVARERGCGSPEEVVK